MTWLLSSPTDVLAQLETTVVQRWAGSVTQYGCLCCGGFGRQRQHVIHTPDCGLTVLRAHVDAYLGGGEVGAAARERLRGLSDRNAQVLALVAEGLTNRDISARLGLSDRTVRNYLTQMFAVLDVHSRTQLARLAWQADLRTLVE
ncbi:DNA-binding CsgD family transcriptional regulator [Deinococcus metalli]|uniref:DNA-binding CsgD family transcriptional regulator n=1 Tax=Deinococcus metalli TaxID=1141878 RepID=A0A7W8NSN3_9DEIO|nr:helix-turn-helix transcriptional regulator [Deinococcus metalli]MBB5379130.1 DNA-binding CsgD family transcriptional regulator [Deinococcus metalli]GHF65025.1 hypothetical protein GCM10017781_46020 [Deinococcus metalli]